MKEESLVIDLSGTITNSRAHTCKVTKRIDEGEMYRNIVSFIIVYRAWHCVLDIVGVQ